MANDSTLNEEDRKKLQDLLDHRKEFHNPQTENGEPLRSERYGCFLIDEYAPYWEISLDWTDEISVRKSNAERFWEMFYRLSEGEHYDLARSRTYNPSSRSRGNELKGEELQIFIEEGYLPEDLRDDAKKLIENEYGLDQIT